MIEIEVEMSSDVLAAEAASSAVSTFTYIINQLVNLRIKMIKCCYNSMLLQ